MSDTAFAKLKRLKINRYRNIQPGTELHFADGINVLLGKNGSGKTTLLNLLAMVVSGNFHPIRREEFALEFDLSYADRPETWSVVIANKKQETVPGKRIHREELLSCSFRIVWTANSVTHVVNGIDQELTMITDGSHKVTSHLSLELGPIGESGNNFLENVIILSNFPRQVPRLDEARDWLREIFPADLPFVSVSNFGDLIAGLVPEEYLEILSRKLAGNLHLITIVLNSHDLRSFSLIIHALGYNDGHVVFERLGGDNKHPSFGSPRFHFTMRDGTSIRLQDLSFGEQRLFAYYYYLACSPQVVIADELTNGMHHEMVRGCIQAIGQRQAFLATQNPLLLDHLEFASIDAARESFILCSKELIDSTERMTFRQMSEDEGREFFGHYGAEQQHVNEILRCLGLW